MAAAGVSRFCTGFTSYSSGNGSFMVDVDETATGVTAGTVEPILVPTQLPSGIINWNCGTGNTSTANIRLLPASCRGS